MEQCGSTSRKLISYLSKMLLFAVVLLLQACASGPKVYSDGTIAVKLKISKSSAVKLSEEQKKVREQNTSTFFRNYGLEEIVGAGMMPYSEDDGETAASVSPVRDEFKWFEYSLKGVSTKGFIEDSGELEIKDAWQRVYDHVTSQSSNLSKLNTLKMINEFDEFEVVSIDPNFILVNRDYEKKHDELEKKNNVKADPKESPKGNTDSFVVVSKPSDIWGHGEPDWHLTHSQLDIARGRLKEYFQQDPNAERVLIAHLDTGFYSKEALMFDQRASDNFGKHFNNRSHNTFGKPCKANSKLTEKEVSEGQCPGHGTETLSVLAGGNYSFKLDGNSYSGILGANPYADTLDYRIADGVVHLFPQKMAQAINSAVSNRADIITLSAGGLPSPMQRDAVNNAYENGVAIFAATGDFFKSPIPIFWIKQTPSTVGFPARYGRVMAVAGTTYDYTSYGENPSFWKLVEHPTQILSWMFRGNYGPEAVMSPMKAVSAYAPNVLKAESRSAHDGEQLVREVSLNGGGTSHATPQVAGAASIWWQLNKSDYEKQKKDFEDNENKKSVDENKEKWKAWVKAEAIYQAISVCSADHPEKYDRKFQEHFGAGHLKANDALKVKLPVNATERLAKRPLSRIGYTWLYDLINSSTVLKSDTKYYKALLMLEAIQFATIDDGLSSAKAELDQCLYQRSGEKSCQKAAVNFINQLSAYPHLSQDLKDVLRDIKVGNIPDVLKEVDECKLEKV